MNIFIAGRWEVCAIDCSWSSENSLLEFILSFHSMGPIGQTHVTICGKGPFSLRYLATPFILLLMITIGKIKTDCLCLFPHILLVILLRMVNFLCIET